MEFGEIQMPIGAWDAINNSKEPRKESIVFTLNKPVIVKFLTDRPREVNWKDGVFYVFDVDDNMVIKTSAWTLLRGLKSFSPLKDKTLVITKVMEKGKQIFKVENGDFK